MSNEDGWETIEDVECLLVMDATDRKVYITRNPAGVALWAKEGMYQHSREGEPEKPTEHFVLLTMRSERNIMMSVMVECFHLLAGQPRPAPVPKAEKETE